MSRGRWAARAAAGPTWRRRAAPIPRLCRRLSHRCAGGWRNVSEPLAVKAANRIAEYLRLAGLQSLYAREGDVQRAIHDLMEAMGEKVEVADPATLYSYQVPLLTEDGACSIVDEMA